MVDSLQQWPWVPYQHTPSSLFSSLSGGNNKDVLASHDVTIAQMVFLFNICLFSLENCEVYMPWLSHLFVYSYVDIQCVLKKVLMWL